MREISFGKFMTILDLWCLIAKSCKKFTGGKENVSAIAVEIIKVTKTLIVKAMSSPSSWIWAIDNVLKFLLHLKEFYWLSTWQHLLTFIHLRYLLYAFSYDLSVFNTCNFTYINGLGYYFTFLLVYWFQTFVFYCI